jgi:hypothetical protein
MDSILITLHIVENMEPDQIKHEVAGALFLMYPSHFVVPLQPDSSNICSMVKFSCCDPSDESQVVA